MILTKGTQIQARVPNVKTYFCPNCSVYVQFFTLLFSLLVPKMNSLGCSSKWPSYDSLRSTPSFLLSESEQTEDEADISSEGEGDTEPNKSFSANEGIRLSGSFLDFAGYSDKLYSGSKNDPSELCPGKIKLLDSAASLGATTVESSSATPGDTAFAQKVGTLKLIYFQLFGKSLYNNMCVVISCSYFFKCADLHNFICPLLKLLRGLKAGRFEKGTWLNNIKQNFNLFSHFSESKLVIEP